MRASRPFDISGFNDRLVGINTTLTAQHAADITEDILSNADLQNSLGIDNFQVRIAQDANRVKDEYDLADGSSVSDTLMSRSFCIGSHSNEVNSDANKTMATEIFRLIGSNESRLSFALCRIGRIVTETGPGRDYHAAEGDTHWTSLHARITNPTVGPKQLQLFHANSAGDNIPDGINRVMELINNIPDVTDFDEARDYLVNEHFIDLGDGDINTTNQLIIQGLLSLKLGNAVIQPGIVPVRCARQHHNTAGFGNTCCDNSIFNMLSMHYDDNLPTHPSIGSEARGPKLDSWNDFIIKARQRLNEIILQRNPAAAAGSGISTRPRRIYSRLPIHEFSDRLSKIDSSEIKLPGDYIDKINELQNLKNDIIEHIKKKPSDSKAKETLKYTIISIENDLNNLINFTIEVSPNPEEVTENLKTLHENYIKNINLRKESDDILDEIIKIIQITFPKTATSSPSTSSTRHSSAPKTTSSYKIPRIVIPELSDIEKTLITKYQPYKYTTPIAQILSEEITEHHNAHSRNEKNLEEFLKPRTYSGIGARTKYSYNAEKKQFEFTIQEVFKGGLAEKLGLAVDHKIIYKFEDNNIESLKEVVHNIRQIALLSLRINSLPAEKELIRSTKEKISVVNKVNKIQSGIVKKILGGDGVKTEKILIHDKVTYDDPSKFLSAIQETRAKVTKHPLAIPSKPDAAPVDLHRTTSPSLP